jgi:rubrerythrin
MFQWAMDWSPFIVCAPDEEAPKTRGMHGPEGLGDRLRTAGFAERQAAEAFRWAAAGFAQAPPRLREIWGELAIEEEKHLGWILKRMEQLGVDPAGRPVSDRLWRALSSCTNHGDFTRLMARAEERGKAAEESFRKSLAERDPETAAVFGRIADEEERHIELQRGYV